MLKSEVELGKSCKFIFKGEENTAYINSGTVFEDGGSVIFLKDKNYFFVGENTILRKNSKLSLDKNDTVYICGNTRACFSNIALWSNSIFLHGFGSGGGFTCSFKPCTNLLIGSDCIFASRVFMRTGDGHAIYDGNSKRLINLPQSIVIGDHVWIGMDVRILKGVKINNGSIIGACSLLVNSNIQEKCIAAGVPAKTIKENILWTRKESYDDEDIYSLPDVQPREIGIDKLLKINEINQSIAAKDKINAINVIINA